MLCPECQGKTKVINTGSINRKIKAPNKLSSELDAYTLRRMACYECDFRFNSIEITCADYDLLRGKFRAGFANDLIEQLTEKDNAIS